MGKQALLLVIGYSLIFLMTGAMMSNSTVDAFRNAMDYYEGNIVRDIADALDDSGLPPSRLILEITESVLMVDTTATLSRLFQLKSLGVRLAIDDFGTGYSSFAYLRRFPIDIIKIDKSFVDGVANEPTASALVDAMIRMGKTLRLETVAEGVELRDSRERRRVQRGRQPSGLFSHEHGHRHRHGGLPNR